MKKRKFGLKTWAASFQKASKKKKVVILCSVLFVLIVLGAGIFRIRTLSMKGLSKDAISVREATVTTGDISNTVVGTGNLESDETASIKIPSGITIEEVKVESGDYVSAGDVLAVVNEVSVFSAIKEVQEELDALDKEMSSSQSTTETETITAKVSGRVKKIYAGKGDDVADTMVENAALMLLSIDGKMAVDIKKGASLSKKEAVTVTLSDDTTVDGTVEKISDGTSTITFSDKGIAVGEKVKVTDADGSSLGNGTAYIHQELKITATSGTISGISVSEEQSVTSSTTLLTIKSDGTSAEYQKLAAQREELANSLQKLIALSQTGTITAEQDGTIASVNITANSNTSEGSASSLGSTGNSGSMASTMSSISGETTSLMANQNRTGAVNSLRTLSATTVAAGGTECTKSLTGEAALPSVTTESAASSSTTEDNSSTAATTQQQTSEETSTKEQENTTEQKESNTTQKQTSTEQKNATTEQAPTSDTNLPSTQKASDKNTKSQSKTSTSASSALAVTASSGSSSQSSSGSTSEDSLDSAEVTAFTLASDDSMILSVSVDELDINSISEAQEAQVTLDAIEGETFTGTVVKVGNSASSASGGVAKYTVEISIPKNEQMKVGMNASATIVIENRENVLTIPVNALQEKGDSVFVYTKKDEDGTLSDEQEVTTGLSDGDMVEITEGLSEGDTVYYQKTGSISGQSSDGKPNMDGERGNKANMPGGGMQDGGFPGDSGNGSSMRGGQGGRE